MQFLRYLSLLLFSIIATATLAPNAIHQQLDDFHVPRTLHDNLARATSTAQVSEILDNTKDAPAEVLNKLRSLFFSADEADEQYLRKRGLGLEIRNPAKKPKTPKLGGQETTTAAPAATSASDASLPYDHRGDLAAFMLAGVTILLGLGVGFFG